MRMRMSVVVAVVCLLVTTISAQGDRGRIAGVITDSTGVLLPGVTVTASGAEQRTTVTSDRGAFAFENVLPGKYTIRATLPGFREVTREVYTVRAVVRSGNSGGPMVRTDGKVVGVVFGAALDDSETGFVLTNAQVQPTLAKAPSLTRAVETGSCAA